MNLATSKTRSAIGMRAEPVSVEVHLSNGLPSFTIVGLPEAAVKESKDRVRSAIINSHFEFPCRRITVNLAPADLPKTGSGFDLPIAIGILAASSQIRHDKLATHEFIGELALDGTLRGISAILPVVMGATAHHQQLIIPKSNALEASLSGYGHVYTAESLREVCYFLNHDATLSALPQRPPVTRSDTDLDWSDVKGQFHAKNAMEIAAFGGHSLLLFGPPGSGKTMLAKRLGTLLPLLDETEALECAAIRSIHGQRPNLTHWQQPPLRAPHHTASPVALVGGGNPPKPGEISLAHHGILFLDELPEFNRHVLETLREPLESHQICISRAGRQIEFPARFQLIAAMSPCPCGQLGNPKTNCLCSEQNVKRYLAKISGPLLDRIDLYVNVRALESEELLTPNETSGNESEAIRIKVEASRIRQKERQRCINAHLTARDCEAVCALGEPERQFLKKVMQQLKLSARGYHRLLKVARTIADMRQEEKVSLSALQHALSFRQMVQVQS